MQIQLILRRCSDLRRCLSLWPALLLVLLLVTGCDRVDSTAETPMADPAGAPEPSTPSASEAPDSAEPDRRIVVWAPDFMMLGEETPAQRILSDATRQFQRANPETDVDVQVKARNGPAAVLPYLRSAQQAAPAVLPDLVLIRAADLWQIVDLGLAQPLNDEEFAQRQDFYPFAVDATTYRGGVYGIPYAVELVHLVAMPGQMIPATWDEMLESEERYLIQGRSSETGLNASLLAHYVAAGGVLDEAATPSPAALERLFSFYQDGLAAGVLARESMELTDLNAVWREVGSGIGTVADTRSGLLLAERDALARISFHPTLRADGPSVTLADVWAFVVLAEDPGRRADALAYVSTLLEPAVHGQWTEYASTLPSTRAAVATWDDAQPYYRFLRQLLEAEVAVLPGGREFQEFSRQLQSVQEDVLGGEKSVEEAVAELMLAP